MLVGTKVQAPDNRPLIIPDAAASFVADIGSCRRSLRRQPDLGFSQTWLAAAIDDGRKSFGSMGQGPRLVRTSSTDRTLS